MIIKNRDNRQQQVDYLSDLLERDFSADKKRLIDRELKCLYSGNKGEHSSAYYLDFDFSKTKNWVLIHDLRLELDGDVAQIDHLLIGRMMDIYVIESKNFNYGVSITEEGDFSYFYNNRPYAIPSPIAQNARHIRFLERYFEAHQLLPKRLGMTLKPNYRNIVLISPTSRLSKPSTGTYDCSAVIKSDKFSERFKDDMSDDSFTTAVAGLAKVISQQSLISFAEKLVLQHKPVSVDYVAKFGLQASVEKTDDANTTPQPGVARSCPKCGKEMVRRTAKKGKNAGNAFWGCSAYPACKAVLSVDGEGAEKSSDAVPDLSLEPNASAPKCPRCGGEMVRRTSKKGKNIGEEFWGCEKFPKCFGTIKQS